LLQELTETALFHYALIFSRIGSLLIFVPGLGETYVSARSRLAIALTVSLIFYNPLRNLLPPIPEHVFTVALLILSEVVVGMFIGLIMRIVISALHMAGMKISYMSGMAAATLFDPNQNTQGSLIGGFLGIIGITLFFVSELHHVVFIALFDSYQLFKPATMPMFDDFAFFTYSTMSQAFFIAFKISSPIIIGGIILYLAAGLMGRLMPAMQVFFVLLPIQISGAFIFLALSLSIAMMVFIEFFEETLAKFLN
jgi:flagellar biosynthetic protein FliR